MTLFKIGSKEGRVNIMAEVMERLDNSLEYYGFGNLRKLKSMY